MPILLEAYCTACRCVGVVLTNCDECLYGWACDREECRESVEASHPAVCEEYQDFVRLRTRVRLYMMETGNELEGILVSSQMGTRAGGVPKSGWSEYFAWRGVFEDPNTRGWDSDLVMASTEYMSQVLTVVLAVSRMDVVMAETFVVHVIGAAEYEMGVGNAWEEVLHLFEGLKRVEVVFVGPDVPDVPEEGELRGTTKEVAITAQIPRIPMCFTSYNAYEAKRDAEVVDSVFGGGKRKNVARQEVNGYRSLVPIVSTCEVDLFLYHNSHVSMYR
ncbi:hypothetical protein HDU98_007175 [Podochytrium sp. JEL0797]|nr:hypothetical protein HDU98_007175 [Podochytrium sp. JEL0797]